MSLATRARDSSGLSLEQHEWREVTMFCPQCKAEYRVGFIRCSDCNVELVDHLPVDAPADTSIEHISGGFQTDQLELVVIRTYQSGLDADLAKSVLEAAGIESIITGNDTARRHYYGLALSQGVDLIVRAEDAEDADKILDVDVTDTDEPSRD